VDRHHARDIVPMTEVRRTERGASAVFVAATMLLLMGVAAVAIDVSAGYNERAQDQNAADNGVMAGALDMADRLDGSTITASVLEYAMPNITAEFPGGQTDADWIELWRSCTDDGNPNWVALPEPAAWSGVGTPSNPAGDPATLDCISRTTSLLRVRVPDQLVGTTFGKVLGADSISTFAAAVAKVENTLPVPPIVPYGLAGSATPGEECFGTSSTGTAYGPCTGPSAGTFGTLLSELFGDYYGTPNCNNPTSTNSIRITTAVGIDHELDVWPGAASITPPAAHPGDNNVLPLDDTNRDACVLDPDGNAAPIDGIPINTVTVDSGFPSNEMEAGLVSNDTFLGRRSRLQQWPTEDADGNPITWPTRDVVARRTGGGPGTIWTLDNKGPWEFLVPNGTAIPECQPSFAAYGTPDVPGDESDTFARVQAFNTCLETYAADNHTDVIFGADLDLSPRFVWVPQYTYELPTTGLSYQPIRAFRMAFLGGTYYNCDASGCAVVFYPDSLASGELCDLNPNSLNCAALSLDQFSSWLLPDEAVPDSVKDKLQDALDSLEPVLWQ
jgi:hypothetical protein